MRRNRKIDGAARNIEINALLKFLASYRNRVGAKGNPKKIQDLYISLKNTEVSTEDLTVAWETAIQLKDSPYSSYKEYIGSKANQSVKQLFCFPYAGGSAAIYRDWQSHLGDSDYRVYSMEYPGRGKKTSERLSEDIDSLCELLLAEINKSVDGPFILYGHSLGAILAYEVSVRYQDSRIESIPRQIELIVSGSVAPSHLGDFRGFQELSDDELIDKLIDMKGITRALAEEEDFKRHFLPIIRADFVLLDNYSSTHQKLEVPIKVLYGTEDPYTNEGSCNAWSEFSNVSASLIPVIGDHFFIHETAKVVPLITSSS